MPAAIRSGQPRALVFKGDSGEVEIKPTADTRLYLLEGDQQTELTLERRLDQRVADVSIPGVAPLRALWHGSLEDDYAREAVLGTTTAALLLLEPRLDMAAARERAASLWQARDPGRLARAGAG